MPRAIPGALRPVSAAIAGAGYLLTFAVLCSSTTAAAQTTQPMSLDIHATPSGPADGLFVQLPETARRRHVAARIRFDYLNRPLVVVSPSTNEGVPVIDHRLRLSVGASYGMTDRLSFYFVLPVAIAQTGSTPRGVPVDVGSAAMGDLTLGLNARVYGGRHGFELGFGLGLVEPTGDDDNFMSDGRVGAVTQVRAAYVSRRWLIAGHLGATIRAPRTWVTYRSGSDLQLALGGWFYPVEALRIGLEVAAATGISDRSFLSRGRSTMEAALGARLNVARYLYVEGGLGLGLLDGVGSPRVRATVAVGFRSDEGQ